MGVLKPIELTLPRRRWRSLRQRALRRFGAFGLSFDQVERLYAMPCAYCGAPSETVDRVFNWIGYEPENCVGACGSCNSRKHTKELVEFLREFLEDRNMR